MSYLASDLGVAASTQNQAFNALIFLYRHVLNRPMDDLGKIVRSKRPALLPVVLTTQEVTALLRQMDGMHCLAACLMYGSGLRLMETVRLRVKDIEFDHKIILVRNGKGQKDRVVTLAEELLLPLERHLQSIRNFYEKDCRDGAAAVYLPAALARKYPAAGKEWGWQYVFPATRLSTDPRSGAKRRHHLGKQAIQRAIKKSSARSGHHKACFLSYIEA